MRIHLHFFWVLFVFFKSNFVYINIDAVIKTCFESSHPTLVSICTEQLLFGLLQFLYKNLIICFSAPRIRKIAKI